MVKVFHRFVLVASLLLAVQPLHAQGGAQEEASAHFERGAELYEDGNLDASLIEFERAYQLHPDYRLLYNLAQVQVERHEYVAARDLYLRYLADGAEELSTERRENVEAELERLTQRVANITVKVNVAGAKVLVDDSEVGTSPLSGAVRVNAGKRRIVVTKRGYEPHSETVEVAGQDRAQLFVELVPEAAPVPTTGAGDARGADRGTQSSEVVGEEEANYTPVWWSAGAAVVLGGVAGTFGYLAVDTDQRLDDEFNELPADPERVSDLKSRAETFSWVSDGATIGAVVAAAIAVYYLADPPMESVEGDAAVLRVVPTNVANGAALEFPF